MTPDSPPPLRRIALGDLEHELDTTRRHLARIPDDRLDWRPHEKSFTVGELGAHIASLVSWARMTLESDGFDLAAPRPERTPPESAAEILETFDGNRDALAAAWEGADAEALTRPWTLSDGEDEVFTLPKVAALRSFILSHMIHHRGQLTVYLRMLDVPVPPAYGPTADEEPDWS